MKFPIELNFDIKPIKELCPACSKSLDLGMNHPVVEMDDRVFHMRCALTELASEANEFVQMRRNWR